MIALATTDLTAFGIDLDRPEIEAAFAARGVPVEYVLWSDESVDWARYDLVLIRSTWDYVFHVPEFFAWLEATSGVAPVLNDPRVIRWNHDKTYLDDLAAAGVAVVPTSFSSTGDDVARALGHATSPQVVVKPTVSAGSNLTGRFDAQDPAARALAEQILAQGRTVMVQPYLDSVTHQGETAILHFDGAFSHAIRKGPLLDTGGTLLGGTYTETVDAVVPTDALLDAAGSVLAGFAQVRRQKFADAADLLYARVDLVQDDDGSYRLLELELIEPSLFLHLDPATAARFADAVLARL